MLFIEYRNLSEISLSGSFRGTHCKFPLRSIRFVLCHDHNSFTVVVFARQLNVLLLVVACFSSLWVRCTRCNTSFKSSSTNNHCRETSPSIGSKRPIAENYSDAINPPCRTAKRQRFGDPSFSIRVKTEGDTVSVRAKVNTLPSPNL